MRSTVLAMLAALAATSASGQDADPGRGAELFVENCATCHGTDATGGGPMTEVLSVTPPDLTMIAGGEAFQIAEIVRKIDGRDMIPSHGGPMPVFGHILKGESGVIDDDLGNPVFAPQAILDIAAWLSEIQR